MDNFDNVIKNVIQKQIYEPYELEQAILTAFNTKKQYKANLYTLIKLASAICVCMIIITGVVFAKDISNWIYSIFNPISTGKGVINMAESGYLYNTQMEYIENNGNSIKIDYVMMDDFNLNIVFDLKLKESIDNVYAIEIPDLIILDDNKNIIFCAYNNDVYKKYCKEEGIEYNEDWKNKNFTNEGYQIEIIEKNEDSIKFIFKMYSSEYPRSKELFIKFGNITIIPTIDNIINNDKNYEILGRWNINIELPAAFYNREIIVYNVDNDIYKNKGITIEEIVASYTEMHLHFKVNCVMEPINATKEEVENRIITIMDNDKIDKIVQNPIIENEEGQIFKISTASKEGNFSKIYRKNGDLDVYVTFPLTKYDYTNNLKLKMILNGSEICINLKRSYN